jgi:hypothetical protein
MWNGKNKIYPLESQSPSIIGHSSLQSKFAKKLHTHTHTKQKWILSFQNQCLLIVEPLPCSIACIVFLHSTKKNNKHYTKLSHRINSELITTSKFPFKSFLWMTRRQNKNKRFSAIWIRWAHLNLTSLINNFQSHLFIWQKGTFRWFRWFWHFFNKKLE